MTALLVPIVLAGGQGTRLWPISRAARPKQFLALTQRLTPFQQTLQRVSDRTRYAEPIIVTNTEYRFLAAEQAQEVGLANPVILLEPLARNTMPAIAAAAVFAVQQHGSGALLHILPSDHDLATDNAYWRAVDTATAAAANGKLVTFGVEPTRPETGYGYIEAGPAGADEIRDVLRFVEKPGREQAESMIETGRYFWNSGMFMFAAGAFLDEADRLSPDARNAAQAAVEQASADLDFIRLGSDAFAGAPSVSVDYAIFERTQRAAMVPARFAWSDLGSWDAVWKVSGKDAAGNVATGSTTLSNTTASLVVSERAHIVVEGLDGVAIIASEDAVFVGRLDEAQKIGPLVKRLKSDPGTAPLTEIHRTAYRPWGGYSSVLDGDRFQVKRLFVKPGKRLSLQKHHHRSEHWIVVRGTAEVTIGETVTTVGENQSVYIPQGTQHRLANPGKIVLELIEVQTGSYLGEDDIIRIEDEFGRS